jgi:hypothetical protein
VNQNLGTALQLMGKYRESEEHFERALHLLGLSLKTGQAVRVRVRVSPNPVRVSPNPVRVSPNPVRVSPNPVRVSPNPVRVSPNPSGSALILTLTLALTPTPTPAAAPTPTPTQDPNLALT